MNTSSLSYSSIANAEIIDTKTSTWLARLINKVSTFIARSELEASQARYQLKRQRQAQVNTTSNLSLGQKHQYGLYHTID